MLTSVVGLTEGCMSWVLVVKIGGVTRGVFFNFRKSWNSKKKEEVEGRERERERVNKLIENEDTASSDDGDGDFTADDLNISHGSSDTSHQTASLTVHLSDSLLYITYIHITHNA